MSESRNEMETFSGIQYKAAKYNGLLVLVRDCMTGQKGITCLDCGSDLIVKKGNIKQHHFAHAKGSTCSSYSGYTGKGGETMEHYKAKSKIAERFNNADKLEISRRLCIGCSKNEIITDLAVYKRNGYFACIEFPYTDLKGVKRKADVAIIDNSGNCHFIVEIKKTHATPEENREGCAWVELCATSVIHNTDDKFICIRCPNRYCNDCQNEFKRRQELLKQEREREERRRIMIEKMAEQRKEEAKRMADELEEKERKRKENEEKERQRKIKLIEFHRRQNEERFRLRKEEEERKRKEDEDRFRLRKEEEERKRKEDEERIQKQKEEQRIAHERELRIWHMIRQYKLDYTEVLKEIKTTVKWIEPIKPPVKKMVLTTNTSCKSRYCLSCKRYNNGITDRCVCERPRYKPLDGILMFA